MKLFTVIDTDTSKEADPEEIALNAKSGFASGLVYCDMDGWYVDAHGDLALLDECGNYDYPDNTRYQLVWNKEALREILGES